MSLTTAEVTIAAVQMEPSLGRVEANVSEMLRLFEEAVDQGAKLVAFPECAVTGYGFESRAEGWEVSEPRDGSSVSRFVEVCRRRDAFAVVGTLERDETGPTPRLYNAAVLVGPQGVVDSYRKVHLPFLGIDRFVDPGDRPFAVVEAAGIKIGMLICYDVSFPEAARVLTLKGAELLVVPTNWPTHSECAAEHVIPTRAHENVIYVMAVNRVGEERGFHFVGRSSIVDPTGHRLAMAPPDSPAILTATINPAHARVKRLVRVPDRHIIDRIADRRPEFYTALCHSPVAVGDGPSSQPRP